MAEGYPALWPRDRITAQAGAIASDGAETAGQALGAQAEELRMRAAALRDLPL